MNFDAVMSTVTSIPIDWFIIGGFALVAALDCVRSGAKRVTQLALAFPLAALLMQSLPNAYILGGIASQFSTPLMQALLLGVLFVALYLFIGRIGLSWGGGEGQTIQAAIAGVAAAGVVMTMWIATPALQSLWQFGPQIQEIFGETYRFFWLIGAFAALAYVRNS
ncbi:hypothetical protein HY414_01130 [Candidatus Kaiserbacteria bacterium]|nr:hypothetical protein [Candidatus Kaiserbacteria bacterium]